MSKTVIVVGRGISGAFVAYFLSGMGAKVIVVDPGVSAGRASDNNPGGLNPLHGPGVPGLMSQFAMSSYRLHLSEWTRIEDASGTAFSGRTVARIFAAFTEAEAERLNLTKKLYEQADGFASEWIDGEALVKLDSRINCDVVGGLWTHGNASVDPGAYTDAVIKAAIAQGAVEKRGRVSGVEASDGVVQRVVVDSQPLACDEVVYTTGAWVESINSAFDIAVPVRPVRGQLLLAELAPTAPDHDISWNRYGIYHVCGRYYWLGGTFEESGFDASATDVGKRAITEGVCRIVPELAQCPIVRHTAGLRPMTPDGLPILDGVPGYRNAWLVLGGGSKGMLLSSGLGKAAAEMVAGSAIDEAPACFSLTRFNGAQTVSSPMTDHHNKRGLT